MEDVSVPSRSLEQWLAYLEAIHPVTIELGLERVGEVAQRLGLAHLNPAKVVLVAGTNGKGSTCCYMEQCLLEAGYRVGVYSSPHVLDYRERVRFNNNVLAEQVHCKAFAVVEQARGNISLSYFEFGTLAGLYLLQQAQLDVIILEVGLGGRLDATNVVEPDVSIVTSIDFDHQAFLGSDLNGIGFEKAGVFRSGKPAILGSEDLPASVLNHALTIGAVPYGLGRDFHLSTTDTGYCFHGQRQVWPAIPKPSLPLLNVATALAALEQLDLPLTSQAICAGIGKASLPGRWQVLQHQPQIVLDVAHNPESARLLAKTVQEQTCHKVLAVVAMLADKDSKNSLQPMAEVVDHWFVAGLDVPRGASAEQLSCHLNSSSVNCFLSVEQAFDAAVNAATNDDLILVFGSFYTVAAVLTAFSKGKE